MNYQSALHKVLSDPSFVPPEGLLDLNLKGRFKNLLKSCQKKVYVEFAVNEARLVLPIFEDVYPNDTRLRRTLLMIEEWLKDSTVDLHTAAAANVYDCILTNTSFITVIDAVASASAAAAGETAESAALVAAEAVITAYYAACNASAVSATHVAYYVRRANPSITLEDQIRRLLSYL